MTVAGWVLIIFAHVGALGDGNSNALTTAYFTSQEACVAAGQATKKLAQGTVKSIDFVCVKQ